jgi:hypothetical protein
MSLTLIASNGIRLEHVWTDCKTDGHAWSSMEGHCTVCDFGLDSCKVCRCDNQGGSTTHCPGNLPVGSSSLITALVYHGGLDYVNGEWIWRTERRCYNAERNTIHVVEHTGSIERFIAWAEADMASANKNRPPLYLTSYGDKLQIFITRKKRSR